MSELIQPVIARPASKRVVVDSMVRYCRDFDGTELKVIDVSDEGFTTPFPHNDFPCRQAHALHTVALAMKPHPFIWIEPDSVPVKRGWAKALSDEYHRLGKPYMLPFLPPEQPFDIASGIGVYAGDTDETIPFLFDRHGWDYWMLQNLDGKLSRTRLIQHNYGEYDGAGNLRRVYRFPQDSGIIKAETVLFHRDRHQDLINMTRTVNVINMATLSAERRFLHSGDLGDIIAALTAIRQLGGGELIITDTNYPHTVRQAMKGARYESIAPLLSAQPYITAVRFEENVPRTTVSTPSNPIRETKQYKATEREARQVAAGIGLRLDHMTPEEVLAVLKTYGIPNASPALQVAIKTGNVVPLPPGEIQKPYITHDFTNFRDRFVSIEESLAHWQGRHMGITTLDTNPWLTVEASDKAKGRVIVTRTLRYRNETFDWTRVIKKYGERIVFIGMDDEYLDFQALSLAPIERMRVNNLLEMGQLIKGADLLVCNQSCPFWLAAGMGTTIVQETWLEQPNSVIPRENARYIRAGEDC